MNFLLRKSIYFLPEKFQQKLIWCTISIADTLVIEMLQKDTDEEVREFLQNNLHLQGKVSTNRQVNETPRLLLVSIHTSLSVCRWRTRLCAGRWLFIKRPQGKLKMLMHQRRLWREFRKFLLFSTILSWWGWFELSHTPVASLHKGQTGTGYFSEQKLKLLTKKHFC